MQYITPFLGGVIIGLIFGIWFHARVMTHAVIVRPTSTSTNEVIAAGIPILRTVVVMLCVAAVAIAAALSKHVIGL